MDNVTKLSSDYNIRPVDNGYLVVSSWSEKEVGKEFSNYKTRTSIYSDWSGVVDFITNNKLDIPPVV